mmetsp:Transcript_6259/g.7647  ORF Transcript_6259/g.7647 Transcript_6259/m.7647 type:complete len:228 (+) Transcript_6259:1404-2087(+)
MSQLSRQPQNLLICHQKFQPVPQLLSRLVYPPSNLPQLPHRARPWSPPHPTHHKYPLIHQLNYQPLIQHLFQHHIQHAHRRCILLATRPMCPPLHRPRCRAMPHPSPQPQCHLLTRPTCQLPSRLINQPIYPLRIQPTHLLHSPLLIQQESQPLSLLHGCPHPSQQIYPLCTPLIFQLQFQPMAQPHSLLQCPQTFQHISLLQCLQCLPPLTATTLSQLTLLLSTRT